MFRKSIQVLSQPANTWTGTRQTPLLPQRFNSGRDKKQESTSFLSAKVIGKSYQEENKKLGGSKSLMLSNPEK